MAALFGRAQAMLVRGSSGRSGSCHAARSFVPRRSSLYRDPVSAFEPFPARVQYRSFEDAAAGLDQPPGCNVTFPAHHRDAQMAQCPRLRLRLGGGRHLGADPLPAPGWPNAVPDVTRDRARIVVGKFMAQMQRPQEFTAVLNEPERGAGSKF